VNFENRYDAAVVAYAHLLIRWRWAVLLLGLAGFAAMVAGLQHFVFNESYREFFAADNPELVAYDKVQNTFSKNDSVFFTVTPPSGNVFSRDALNAIEMLTEGGWQLPFALRVDSVTNFQHTRSEADDLMVGPLVEDPDVATEAELATAREIALNEPFLRDRLVNRAGTVAGVNVTIHLPEKEPGEAIPIVGEARALRDAVEAAYPGVEIGLTGIIPLNHAFLEATEKDAKTIVPIMVAIILGTMFWLLRSVLLMLSTAIVVAIATVGGIGMVSWLGLSLSGPSSPAPVMIMTLAVADCVHILISLLYFMRQGHSQHAALVESLRINMTPVFLTSLTTVIGFLSMNINSVPPIAMLGNTTAMGVAIAFVYSITFLPALVAVLPIGRSLLSEDRTTRAAMLRLAEWIIVYRRPVFWVSILVSCVMGLGVFLIPINNQFVDWFDDSIPIRHDTDYAVEQLSGIYQLTYVLDSGAPEGASDPEYLANLEKFCNWVVTLPEVNHASSVADIMKRLNRSFHGDDPAYYAIPESRELGGAVPVRVRALTATGAGSHHADQSRQVGDACGCYGAEPAVRGYPHADRHHRRLATRKSPRAHALGGLRSGGHVRAYFGQDDGEPLGEQPGGALTRVFHADHRAA
jgi:predicted RND superfamily exporter protein